MFFDLQPLPEALIYDALTGVVVDVVDVYENYNSIKSLFEDGWFISSL